MNETVALGSMLPDVTVLPPGPRSRALADRLSKVESRDVTYLADDWPIFWAEAVGTNVRDVDGNVYVDLTSAFGVALLGHRNEPVLRALSDQTGLVHGMGDVHPPAGKVDLLERLVRVAPWPDTRVVLGGSGSDAVEAALKTAQLASGRPGILAFEGGYHGLTLGSLAATERAHFRRPFTGRVYEGVAFAPFPNSSRAEGSPGERSLTAARGFLERGAPNGDPIGTVIIEPMQARGGARMPPPGFMAALSELAAQHGALLVADEIFTGLGRCGAMLASPLVGLRPDVVCVGKTLGGGLPISACMAPAGIMDAWPPSTGEAIHTSTFLGHPLACAAASSVLQALEDEDVPNTAARKGAALLERLRERLAGLAGVGEVRGLGLLLGIEFVEADGRTPRAGVGATIARRALREGLIVLPAGEHAEVLELAPPVTLTDQQAAYAVETIGRLVEAVA